LKVKTGLWVESLLPVVCEATNTMVAPRKGQRPPGGKEICAVTMKLRGKNMRDAAPSANQDTAYAVSGALMQIPHFETNFLSGDLTSSADDVTFGFEIKAMLKRPIKL